MNYPGGKNGSGVVQAIINQIPPHKTYFEAFLGSGPVMRAKRPAPESIGVDSDAAVVVRWCDHTDQSGEAEGKWRLPPGGSVILGDAISFLSSYQWRGGEFVYCDPPYLFDVRSSRRAMYTAEFGEVDDHQRLLRLLRSLPCMVALSGYFSELYADSLAEWRHVTFNTVARSGEVKTEWLWMNYPEPQALHDYRFLGDNYRERERLARMRRRWLARLARMEPLERLMLSAAIAESGGVSCKPSPDPAILATTNPPAASLFAAGLDETSNYLNVTHTVNAAKE